jgi:hypothetical protein
MKLNKLFKLTSVSAVLAVSTTALATDVTVPLSFKTLPVITVTEVKAMDFGAVLTLAQADTCTMSTTAGGKVTLSDEGQDLATITTGGTGLAAPLGGQLSNDCAGAPDGQPGIYQISSFEGADITVNLATGTATDISLNPAGYVVDLNDDLQTNSTASRETLAIGTDAAVRASGALTAYSQKGINRVVIGGTIINQNALTADTAYNTDFTINVTYQ